MKKYLVFLTIAVGLMAFTFIGLFYDLPLATIDGQTVDLRRLEGKRVLIILLPLTIDDSLSITPGQIAALANTYRDSLTIIGVPGEEAGYTDAVKERVRALYANEPANFIFASGMKVSKSSGQGQSPLFQWLTDISKNGFFDRDAGVTGQKFFVNRYGHLYAVMGPHVKLSNPIITRALSERGH